IASGRNPDSGTASGTASGLASRAISCEPHGVRSARHARMGFLILPLREGADMVIRKGLAGLAACAAAACAVLGGTSSVRAGDQPAPGSAADRLSLGRVQFLDEATTGPS